MEDADKKAVNERNLDSSDAKMHPSHSSTLCVVMLEVYANRILRRRHTGKVSGGPKTSDDNRHPAESCCRYASIIQVLTVTYNLL